MTRSSVFHIIPYSLHIRADHLIQDRYGDDIAYDSLGVRISGLASTSTTAVISVAASTTAAKENQDDPDAVASITSAATATVISKTISAA